MMDSPHQFGTLMYTSPITHRDDSLDINASMAEANWNHHSSSNASSSSGQVSQLYPIVPRSADHVDYSSPSASSFIHHSDLYAGHHQSHAPEGSSHPSSLSLNQVESSIGPSRVLTRRQRAVIHQGGVRRVSAPSNMYGDNHDNSERPQRHPTGYLLPRNRSRPGTPNHSATNQYPQHSERLSVTMSAVPLQLQSPHYTSTPLSASSTYSPYDLYSTHSRSNSTSTSNPRSESPALSAASALTSISSANSPPNVQPFTAFAHPSTATLSPIAPREKMKKQRLYNVDRKAICEFHKENPNARQEDIARRYKVERSTISKILKHKTKWLNVPEEEQMRVAKHRPSKFPEVEEELVKWLVDARKSGTVLTDALIRANAKETARKLHISDEKFKASSGWVENFKHRHGIRGGIWHGDGKNTRLARAMGTGTLEDSLKGHEDALSPLNPAFDAHLDTMDDRPPTTHPHYGAEMDDGYESEGSPDSDMRTGESESSSLTLQPAWRTPPEHPDPNSVSPSQSFHHSDSPVIHNPPALPSLFQHQRQGDSAMAHHPPQPPELQQQTHHESSAAFNEGLVMYQPIPPPSNGPPTLADAEEAINKVITFVDTTGHGLLTDEERQNLHQIKTILFQAGSGVPFR